jgi:hypothetical protein
MVDANPDPDPARTAGLEPGGAVPEGETPPAEGSTSGAGPQETYNPVTGWARAPLIIILVLVGLVAAFFLAYALAV